MQSSAPSRASPSAPAPWTRNAHHLVNRTDRDVVYLEIGERVSPEVVTYPDDDIHGAHDAQGRWKYSHKDGTPY